MTDTIRFWVGAGNAKVSLSPQDPSLVNNQAVFVEVPELSMELPVRSGKSVAMKQTTIREWLFNMLKDSEGNKTHQTWVELPMDFVVTRYAKKDNRPYRQVNFADAEAGEVLVSFIKQCWDNLAEKQVRGEKSVQAAQAALSSIKW